MRRCARDAYSSQICHEFLQISGGVLLGLATMRAGVVIYPKKLAVSQKTCHTAKRF
jgi:hypothetical protein